MKTKGEIEGALVGVADADTQGSKYPGMTYEQGIAEALRWVLGDIPDEEFSPLETDD